MSFKVFKEKYNLPDSIEVEIKKTKNGFYAFLPDYPGCVTIAKNMGELIENVNDAVLTYFDVPAKVAKKADLLYFPSLSPRRISASAVKPKKSEYGPLRFISVPPQRIYA